MPLTVASAKSILESALLALKTQASSRMYMVSSKQMIPAMQRASARMKITTTTQKHFQVFGSWVRVPRIFFIAVNRVQRILFIAMKGQEWTKMGEGLAAARSGRAAVGIPDSP